MKDDISSSESDETDEERGIISSFDYCRADNLNVPVPFKPGDIITYDGFPFGPKGHILIVEVGDNRDCCCLQGLSLDTDGKWIMGAVKHGSAQHYYFPRISPLFTAEIYNGEPEEKEKVMLDISKMIDGKEENGRKFWHALFRERA